MKKLYFFLFAVYVILNSCASSKEDSIVSALMLGGSSQAPVFLNCRAVSEKEVEFEFSSPVSVTSLNFDPEIKIVSIENGNVVKVQLEETQEPGRLIYVDLLAEDERKNTVNVLAQLRARNNRMPKLVINEICTEYSNAAAGKKEEFIEFKIKSAGNLGAMRVVIIGNSSAAKQTIYEFSSVEVKKDEYMVLHLRTFDAASKDEYTSALDESRGVNASPTARDFWIPGETKLLHKTAMIYVLDQDDNVIDAVVLSDKPDLWWPKDYFAETAEFLYNKGAWVSANGGVCSPQDAVTSANATNTRTICRDETIENSNTAKDWYVTITSGATPGKPNNPGRYLK
jgi:hypothetical protein